MSNFDEQYDEQFDAQEQSLDGIAIIGVSGRFPGAKNVQEFWSNIKNGVESITFFTDEELQHIDPQLRNDPLYVKAGGEFADKALFDAEFFDFTPREAEVTDPQHRLFLECSYEALEVSGYHTGEGNRRIGVFAGVTSNGYVNNVLSHANLVQSLGELQVNIGTGHDFLATRVSYKLNLNGPAMTVQTACSTSLVAIHQACQNLLMMECDMALAGGASLRSTQKEGYLYQEGGIHSPDGHCRTFDASAQGTVSGEGVGVVLLKRLEDALTDGDTIYAVIKGSAINNDGAQKIGYTAPSVDGQAEVIAEALAVAGVSPDTIGLVEAHGTATPLGDPIEIAALTQAYRASTDQRGYVAIGSAKSNIGHLDAAAGVTGLIKAVMALQEAVLPPSLHFVKANEKLDLDNSPFFVNTKLQAWEKGPTPRRAGVSSFGIGGTNAHVVLEEAPVVERSSQSTAPQVLVLSAKSAQALDVATANLAEHLKQHESQEVADIAYTLQTGRRSFAHRRMVVVHDRLDAIEVLEKRDPARVLTQQIAQRAHSVAFLFPGQGAQYVNMGRELYTAEPVFQVQVDLCAEMLMPLLGCDLRDVLFPPAGQEEAAKQKLAQTMYTQPAIFVIEYALAMLWQSYGVRPAAMIGHSIGEYVAACMAGVMSLPDALRLVATRGKLMQELPRGAMLAISLPEAEVVAMLGTELSLAAVNGPAACVISGTTEAVEALAKQLEAQEIVHHRLDTSHAFHSAMMEPILPSFTEVVRGIELYAPNLPYLSNVTGTWITAEQATDPSYWTKHLRQTVRYADGVHELLNVTGHLLLEVGPGRVLGTLAGQQMSPDASQAVALYSLRHRDEQVSDVAFLRGTLGKLWLHGGSVEWTSLYAGEQRRKVALPTYPFERKSYWVDAKTLPAGMASQESGKKADLADWFYMPVWKRTMPVQGAIGEQERNAYLVFLNIDSGTSGTHHFSAKLVERLQRDGHKVVSVTAGDSFAKQDASAYVINPQLREDYRALFDALSEAGEVPKQIVHLWGLTDSENEVVKPHVNLDTYEMAQSLSFYSLLFLAQSIGEQNMRGTFHIEVVTNQLHDVTGETVLAPERATMLGAVKVIPQELANITTRNIDVELPKHGSHAEERLIDQLLSEMSVTADETFVAYRRNHRLVRTFDEAKLTPVHELAMQNSTTNRGAHLQKGGTYLITGATEPNGLALAEHLANTYQAKLILVAQTDFPLSNTWQHHVDIHGTSEVSHNASNDFGGFNDITSSHQVTQTIQRLRTIESLGHGMLFLPADVTDLTQMQQVIDQAHAAFGDIRGVFHTAEVKGSGLMQLKTADQFATVLDPKVKGTLTLEAALANAELDFFVLFSSTSSLLGGLGQVDSAAAHAFLDAYAHHKTEQGRYTVAINWGTWQWDDWLERQSAGVPEFQQQLRNAREQYGISFDEGMQTLSRILASQLPQVVVSTEDFNALLQEQGAFTATSYLNAVEEARRGQEQEQVDDHNYVAPTNETEQMLAELWKEIFGVKRVSLHDNFFELGGNSLVAIQLITRIRQKFKMDFPINVIFESPSVSGLAQLIASKQLDEEKLDKLEQMLREIEALSLQEVKSKLESN